MGVRVAINGLGRIGRPVLKIALERGVNIVAVNDLTDSKTLAYLLKNDSVYGKYKEKIESGKDFLKIGNKKILVFSESEPEKLPWKELKIDVVIESSGVFTERKQAERHLSAGAKKVVISAPAKNPDITVVLGVNEGQLKKSDKIISMASCTTNCFAPVAKILNDEFKIRKGFMTTIHAYTNDQKILDLPHKNLRRARAAALNIIPTTTGASESVCEVIPALRGRLKGLAFRVPVACGSIVDFVAEIEKPADREKINKAFKKASKGKFKGILDYSEEELVSSDIIGNANSAVVDGLSTQVLNSGKSGNLVKVLAWYDNEYGYSCRMVDLLKKL